MQLPISKSMLNWLLHAAGALPLAICLAGYWFWIHAPVVTAIERETVSIYRMEEQLSKAKDVRTEHESVSRSLEETRENANEIKRRMPDDPNDAGFLKQVSAAAVSRTVELRDYNRIGEREFEEYSELEIRFVSRGSFSSLCEFIHDLSELPRVCRFKTLTFTRESDGAVDLDLTMLIYFGARSPAGEGAK